MTSINTLYLQSEKEIKSKLKHILSSHNGGFDYHV